MDPGETLVLFGIVTLCLLFVSSIMVSRSVGRSSKSQSLTPSRLGWPGSWALDFPSCRTRSASRRRFLSARAPRPDATSCSVPHGFVFGLCITTRLAMPPGAHRDFSIPWRIVHGSCSLLGLVAYPFDILGDLLPARFCLFSLGPASPQSAYVTIVSRESQHGCQIAIPSFHDSGCAEEVLKSNLAWLLACPNGRHGVSWPWT